MELETHYSLRCLLNAQSGLRSTAAELAKLRRRLDKMLREKGMETARPFMIPSCAEKKSSAAF